MFDIDAQNILIEHLQTMPGRPALMYHTGPVVTDFPRIFVEPLRGSQAPLTIKGRSIGMAEVMARIETASGSFSTEAQAIARLIKERFKPVQRLDGVTVKDAPYTGATYTENGVFYMPVIIQGRFYN